MKKGFIRLILEFEINANFYGPEAGAYIAEFLFVARNKGNVQQKFNDIRIRVRGIDDGQGFQFWEGNEPRLNFPRRLVKQKSILPDDYSFFFVEPGIEQVFTYQKYRSTQNTYWSTQSLNTINIPRIQQNEYLK